MPPRRRSQTNPQPPLTQEAVNQLVRDRIKAAIRAERERVTEEATRAGGRTATPALSLVRKDEEYFWDKDAAMAAREDDDDYITAPRDAYPSEPHGSPRES
nr:hypothetical protein [Tanacetum cinerariifolium]